MVSHGFLGSSEALLDHPHVRQGAQMEGLVPEQVLMKWALQRGLHVIPAASWICIR